MFHGLRISRLLVTTIRRTYADRKNGRGACPLESPQRLVNITKLVS